MYRRLSLANLQAIGDQANATVIAAPGAGKRLVVHSILATLLAAGTIVLSEGDATAVNRAYLATYNRDPRPFRWTTTADEIPARVSRMCRRISGSGR